MTRKSWRFISGLAVSILLFCLSLTAAAQDNPEMDMSDADPAEVEEILKGGSTQAGESVAPADGPVQPEPGEEKKSLPPPGPRKLSIQNAEDYYQLLLERQGLTISSHRRVLEILESHGGDQLAAMKDLKNHDKERLRKSDELFKKYGTSHEEYYGSVKGSDTLKERSAYLDEHPEIRDQLAANSKEIKSLEKAVWSALRPLWRDAPGG